MCKVTYHRSTRVTESCISTSNTEWNEIRKLCQTLFTLVYWNVFIQVVALWPLKKYRSTVIRGLFVSIDYTMHLILKYLDIIITIFIRYYFHQLHIAFDFSWLIVKIPQNTSYLIITIISIIILSLILITIFIR